MKISIILGHPTKGSFNHAIAETVKIFFKDRKDNVFFHDLYDEKFNPILSTFEIPKENNVAPDIKKYCEEISISDGIIIIHPNWWGQPPAILKGWIDRVIRPGIAYDFEETDNGEGIPIGLLKAKCAVVFNTSNTPSEREKNIFGDPLEQLWNSCIFDLCGVKKFYRKMFGVVCISTNNKREAWLKDVEKLLSKAFL